VNDNPDMKEKVDLPVILLLQVSSFLPHHVGQTASVEGGGRQQRRAWEWWRLHRDKFVCLSIAARLIVPVQVSSASVECVFSQVKLVTDAIGVNTLKDDNTECAVSLSEF